MEAGQSCVKCWTAGEHLWSEHEEAERSQLLRGAKAGAGRAKAAAARPGMRTAEDIKAAYGRPTSSKRCAYLSWVTSMYKACPSAVQMDHPACVYLSCRLLRMELLHESVDKACLAPADLSRRPVL